MTKKLNTYQKKRNFHITPEPQGGKSKSKERQFVVQYHVARNPHYDFRLQWNDVLLSWAIPKGPSFCSKDKRLAVHVEDHPLDYATFEGCIPKGQYGGGTVMVWDIGTWEVEVFEKDIIKFKLNGKRLKGRWSLIHLKQEEKKDLWILIKEKDEYEKKSAGISRFTRSILTNRTIKEIAEGVKNPFSHFSVQLAKLEDKLPNEKDYLYEIKYDGYRIIAVIENNKVDLFTRNHIQVNMDYPKIKESLLTFFSGKSLILDGEIVVFDKNGKSNFQLLQNKNASPTYMVFDILAYAGNDLRNEPLLKRKEILKQIFQNSPKNIQLCQYILQDGKKFLKEAEKAELEGIIAKKINSIYSGTRNGDWIKIKFRKEQEFVIGGYTFSEKRKIQALLLGVMQENQFVYVGKVGTGFSEKTITELLKKFKNLQRKTSPFVDFSSSKNTIWLRPSLIAEVEYAEFTDTHKLRQASFKGLRMDKETKEVHLEITHPEKIIYPKEKVNKMDVFSYYEKIAPYMLPYLQDRLVSVVRFHQNQCFFKKHPLPLHEGIQVHKITNSKKEKEDYFSITSEKGLLEEVQLGSIEFHTWGSQISKKNRPNLMVFDLDPDEEVSLSQLRQGVKDLKQVLDTLKLESFLKTSGGKGYHLVVPFQNECSWDKFKNFSKQIVVYMEEKWPERYTSNMRKEKRKGKIFIDWVRNSKGATSVVPYSLRMKGKPSVSMPISFKELDLIAPDDILYEEAIKKSKKRDPWKNFFHTSNFLSFD